MKRGEKVSSWKFRGELKTVRNKRRCKSKHFDKKRGEKQSSWNGNLT